MVTDTDTETKPKNKPSYFVLRFVAGGLPETIAADGCDVLGGWMEFYIRVDGIKTRIARYRAECIAGYRMTQAIN